MEKKLQLKTFRTYGEVTMFINEHVHPADVCSILPYITDWSHDNVALYYWDN